MGAQSNIENNRIKQRDFYENRMIKEGENYLMFKYYHLGEPTDFRKLIHLNKLHKAYSSENCEVQNFIKNRTKLKHKYTEVENTNKCEAFEICYEK